jgi:predicted helicase
MADVREMLIQHVLTEDIFMTVFDEPQFHRDNAIAHKLQEVVATFYRAGTQRKIHARIAPYYETINARAAQIYNHHEKQKFLKALYGSFYRAYNPKAADRLGIIYTPDEIVRFKIEAADHLVFKHFGKTLGDAGVEILDPVVGTGTYITELIDYLPPEQLRAKYQHELHCNEVAILPYYIASLNIEYTYKQRTGEYLPFENICFVDTLDNVGFASSAKPQMDFFGLVDENTERIERQNTRKISVIIGNPPYNANQLNENENNKNREYPEIDRRIKETYIRHSTAQKTKVYDMYARFFRWASDRLDENGVVAFITNSSFLDSRTFDGFRRVVADEFSHIYVVDLGGNVRDNPKLSGTTHNVFGIQTGVAIVFLVKKQADLGQCRIFYARRPEMELARDKLQFLRTTKFSEIQFEAIHPDGHHNWLHLTENDWDELMPVASKEVKASKGIGEQQAIFGVVSTGILTGRDDWAIDVAADSLAKKMAFFVDFYESSLGSASGDYDTTIKWSRNLKRKYDRGIREPFAPSRIRRISYRPYCPYLFYDSDAFIDETALMSQVFGSDSNELICFTNLGSQKPFMALASKHKPDYHLVGAASGTQCLPFYRYTATGDRVDNITDWALAQFVSHYTDSQSTNLPITKRAIFHYVYAVLHHPAYRQKYERNLKRELPRIPFYDDFWQWAGWGERLMALHLEYEQAEPYALAREDRDLTGLPNLSGLAPKPRLLARKEAGVIEVDTATTLHGVPAAAWEYRLGTYSALEWVLERYKERTPKDPTIRERFNIYRFADYKEPVIELLRRVTTVSVETMKIVREMPR